MKLLIFFVILVGSYSFGTFVTAPILESLGITYNDDVAICSATILNFIWPIMTFKLLSKLL